MIRRLRRLWDDLTWRATTRTIRAYDLDLCKSGDVFEIGAHTYRRWPGKQVTYIATTRDDLDILADMIGGMLEDESSAEELP